MILAGNLPELKKEEKAIQAMPMVGSSNLYQKEIGFISCTVF